MCRTDRCAVAAGRDRRVVAAGREVVCWCFDRWTRGCGARAAWCAVALDVAAPDDPADEDAPCEDPVCEDWTCEDPSCGAWVAPEEPDDDWLVWSDPEVVAGWGEGEPVTELACTCGAASGCVPA